MPTDHRDFTDMLVPFIIGSIPESLGDLQSLKALFLGANQFTGDSFHFSGWPVPCDHPEFTILLLPFTAGAIPESLGNLQNLKELYLFKNHLSGAFFSFFGMVSAN